MPVNSETGKLSTLKTMALNSFVSCKGSKADSTNYVTPKEAIRIALGDMARWI